jgi:hypothetical protein
MRMTSAASMAKSLNPIERELSPRQEVEGKKPMDCERGEEARIQEDKRLYLPL